MNQREQSLAVRNHLREQDLARRQARHQTGHQTGPQAQRPGVAVVSTRVRHIRESIRAGHYDDAHVLELALDRMMAQG